MKILVRISPLLFLLCWPIASAGQPIPPGAGATSWDDVRLAGSGGVRVRTGWSAPGADGSRTSSVTVTRLSADLHAAGNEVEIHAGATVVPAIAARDGAAVVVLVHEGPRPFVKVAVIDLPATGGLSLRPVVTANRVAGADWSPSWAVATPDPDGFAIFWQETSARDPTAARTFMGRIDGAARWTVEPLLVEVPWAIAAAAWNGHGYHLGLLFGGFGASSSGQMRLCLVTLAPDGSPEQHPWWASPEDQVGDVQLLATPRGIAAFWRGGRDGKRLLSTLSWGIGQWGQEPRSPTSHGEIAASQAFALRAAADGGAEAVRVPE